MHPDPDFAGSAPSAGAMPVLSASAVPVAAHTVDVRASPPSPGLPARPSIRELHVLLVDDAAMNRDVVASFLRSAGHKATCVGSGFEAVMAVAQTDFDIVLMDVRMPEMDGLEATRRIRALEGPRGRVPVIALTAKASPEQIKECQTAGMNAHVTKSFDLDALLAAVIRAAGAQGNPSEAPDRGWASRS